MGNSTSYIFCFVLPTIHGLLVFLSVFFGLSQTQNLEMEDTEGDFGFAGKPTLWKNLDIPVCWEGKRPQKHHLVRQVVEETWVAYSQLNFIGWDVCSSSSKGIRILASDEAAHVKGLGNELDGKQNGMVLNFWFNEWSQACRSKVDQCIRVVAVHEFGHAIGLAHEQNRDDAPAWCREMRQGSAADWKVTIYDPYSIMNYCAPDYWDRTSGSYLSDRDIETVQILYSKKRVDGSACSKYDNRDVAGPNMAFHHNKPESACCSLCRSTRGCRAYAWNNYIGGTCWLKRATQLFVKSGVTAGILRKDCSKKCAKYNNKDVAGPNLDFHHNKREQECCDLCKKKPGCKAYAWNGYEGGTCWLKESTLLFDNQGVKAGVVRQGCVRDSSDAICLKHDDKDVAGPNLAIFHEKSEGSCCGLCSSQIGCRAYAWNGYLGGTCWLKESTQVFDNQGVKAGILS